MELINHDCHPSNQLLDHMTAPPAMTVLQPPPREKNKRPQLSCNPCRARKVKCDRIQPCSACSLHQIADICHYDLSDAERHPILQAEALKEKDKTIASLRDELSSLRGETIKSEYDSFHEVPQKIRLPPRSTRRINQAHHGHSHGSENGEFVFEEPGMTGIADDFNDLSFDRRPPGLAHGTGDISSFHTTDSYPFPTLWSAKDDISSLIKLLPSEHDLLFYLESFQRRSLSFSFPLVPDEVTIPGVQGFMEDIEQSAALYPDWLALLFATLAQGLQDGMYDKTGEKWTSANVKAESKQGDVYLAAAMQCLRLAAFMNRPTLLVIQTLLMMTPYLTNSGKFLDASAVFGATVRLAQSIGLYRDPTQLSMRMTEKETAARKILWWWILYTDQQFSVTLGRPLAVSTLGDCPSPETLLPESLGQNFWTYVTQLSLLGRQILTAPYLANDRIDKFTDDLLILLASLPPGLGFDVTWLDPDKPLVGWPFDVQAVILHAKAHNYLISLNRRRCETLRRNSEDSRINMIHIPPETDISGTVRGRLRVLESCRTVLKVFQFFHTRLRAALICWTMGQMAFNASMLLTLSMLETGETQDLLPVQHAYSTFLEMNKLGIHKLAGAAVERLGRLMKEFRTEDSANETVMGQGGMMLLEVPASHKMVSGNTSGYTTAGSSSPDHTQMTSHPSYRSRPASQRKRQARKSTTTRSARIPKSRRDSLREQRPTTDRRYSDSVTPRPVQRRRLKRSTPHLSLFTSLPDPDIFNASSTTDVKSETLFTPSASTFDDLSRSQFASHTTTPAQDVQQAMDDMSQPPNQQFATPPQRPPSQAQQQRQYHPDQHCPQPRQSPHPHPSQGNMSTHQHPMPPTSQPSLGPEHHPFDFSTSSTPYSAEFFDNSLASVVANGHAFDEQHLTFDHPPFSAPPFSMSGDQAFGVGHF